MATCHACGTEIIGQDRFCRKCGVAVTTSVSDLVDTYRFNPTTPPLTTAQPGASDPNQPFTVPSPTAYAVASGSAPLYHTASVGEKLWRRKKMWRLLGLALLFSLLLTVAANISLRVKDSQRAAQVEQEEVSHQYFEEAVQNALGLKLAEFPESEFPEIHGVFINSLMSESSPAAAATIQAGDVLTELNGQTVSNEDDLRKVLDSLKTGMDVPVKLYRDGETVSLRIKIADRTSAPFQPKIEMKDQGYLGVKEAARRAVPGTSQWGVEIHELADNTPADIIGLQPGDIITEFNGRRIRTTNEFNRLIRAVKPRSEVTIKFYRGNTEQTVKLILGHRW